MSATDQAYKYVAFITNIGISGIESVGDEIPALFSYHHKKTSNNRVQTESVFQQFQELREALGSWRIELQEMLSCIDERICVIHYNLLAEKGGELYIISILRYDDEGLLQEIDEVFHQKLA